MKTIKSYLREFDTIFQFWRASEMTMVIGGLWALKLHGLKVRDTEDLDIIVYNPTDKFIEFLQIENEAEPGSIPKDDKGENWRSWKVTRNGLTIDFITEWEEEVPGNLLAYYFKGKLWHVQDINTVIEKKKMYNREKDLKDLKNFKQDNF